MLTNEMEQLWKTGSEYENYDQENRSETVSDYSKAFSNSYLAYKVKIAEYHRDLKKKDKEQTMSEFATRWRQLICSDIDILTQWGPLIEKVLQKLAAMPKLYSKGSNPRY